MVKAILVCGLVLAALGAQGCIVVNTHEKVDSPPPGPDDPVVREIDAAGQLAFDNNKATVLTNIAQREDISPAAQVHLVDVTFKRLAFEEMKVDVLKALIENPSFCADARSAILARMDRLAFETNKIEILEALSR